MLTTPRRVNVGSSFMLLLDNTLKRLAVLFDINNAISVSVNLYPLLGLWVQMLHAFLHRPVTMPITNFTISGHLLWNYNRTNYLKLRRLLIQPKE